MKRDQMNREFEITQWTGPRLRDLSPEDRPRERIINEGAGRLDQASLLSLLLGTGRSSQEDALMLARRILKTTGSLHALSVAEIETLCTIRGVGPAKAARLIAAFELARRASTPPDEREFAQDEGHRLSLTATLVALARDRWDGESELVIACPKPSGLSFTELQESLESAVTLALGSGLSDAASYGRWLARLLLEESVTSWCLIALRPEDELSPTEREHLPRLIEGAQILQVEIDRIIVASLDHDWPLFESDKERGGER